MTALRHGPIVVRDGYWHADTRDPGSSDRVRFSLRLPAATPKATALQRYHQLLDARRDGQLHPRRRLTVKAAFERVIAHVEATLDPQTLHKYRLTWRHLDTFLDDCAIRRLADLCPEHIASFAAWYQALGRAPAGVNSRLNNLRAALNLLNDWGWMPPDYSSRSWFRRVWLKEERRSRLLSDLELRVLFADTLYGDVYEALYLTGARIGELLPLHTSNIGERTVTYPVSKGGGARVAPLLPDFADFLEAHKSQPRGFILWRAAWGDPFDFRRRGIAKRGILRRQQRVLDAAGYPAARVHDIRATTATRLAPLVSERVLMQIMGWHDHATVARYYRQRPEDVTAPRLSAAAATQT